MLTLAKPNNKKLREVIEYNQKGELVHPGKGIQCEVCARCSMYLGEFPEYVQYMENAIKKQDYIINEVKDSSDFDLATALHTKGNFLRLLFKNDEAKECFKQAVLLYRNVLPHDYKENSYLYLRIFHEIATVEYHLGNYENSIQISQLYIPFEPIASVLSRVALNGIRKDDLSKIMEYLEYIYSREWEMGIDNGSTTSAWDFYEICLQVLGLPSVLDDIKLYLDGKAV